MDQVERLKLAHTQKQQLEDVEVSMCQAKVCIRAWKLLMLFAEENPDIASGSCTWFLAHCYSLSRVALCAYSHNDSNLISS